MVQHNGNDQSINDPGQDGDDFDFSNSNINQSMDRGSEGNARGSIGTNGNLAGGQNTAAQLGSNPNNTQALP